MKTGFTVGPGGATAALGVTPDITCLAKSVGGGLVLGAVGGSAEVMEHVANDDYEMVGTFNGNPLSLCAGRAMVYEVATPEAYDRLANSESGGRARAHGLDRRARASRARRLGRGEGMRDVLDRAGPELPRLPRRGRPVQPRPLVDPAQRGSVPSSLGEDRAVAHVGPARPRTTWTGSSRTSRDSLRPSRARGTRSPCGEAHRVLDSLIECSVSWRPTTRPRQGGPDQ